MVHFPHTASNQQLRQPPALCTASKCTHINLPHCAQLQNADGPASRSGKEVYVVRCFFLETFAFEALPCSLPPVPSVVRDGHGSTRERAVRHAVDNTVSCIPDVTERWQHFVNLYPTLRHLHRGGFLVCASARQSTSECFMRPSRCGIYGAARFRADGVNLFDRTRSSPSHFPRAYIVLCCLGMFLSMPEQHKGGSDRLRVVFATNKGWTEHDTKSGASSARAPCLQQKEPDETRLCQREPTDKKVIRSRVKHQNAKFRK